MKFFIHNLILGAIILPTIAAAQTWTDLNIRPFRYAEHQGITIPYTSNKLISDTIIDNSYRNADSTFLQSQYSILSSAIPIGKGKGYAQLSFLGLSRFSIGITKNITIGAAAHLLPLFEAEPPLLPHLYLCYGGQISKHCFINFESDVGMIEPDDWTNFSPMLFFARSSFTYSRGRLNFSLGAGYGTERIRNRNKYSSKTPEIYYRHLYRPTAQFGARILFTRTFSFFIESLSIPIEIANNRYRPQLLNENSKFYIMQYGQFGIHLDYDRLNIGISGILITQGISGEGPFPNFDLAFKF